MTGAMLAFIVAAAVTGAGAAYLIWVLVLPLLSARPPLTGGDDRLPDAPERADVSQPLPEVPHFPDPSLSAQVAAVRKDMAMLAQTQVEMLEGMEARDSQLLNELRAVVSVRDPELLNSLRRIEARLNGKPLPVPAEVLDATGPEPPPPDTSPGSETPEQDPRETLNTIGRV